MICLMTPVAILRNRPCSSIIIGNWESCLFSLLLYPPLTLSFWISRRYKNSGRLDLSFRVLATSRKFFSWILITSSSLLTPSFPCHLPFPFLRTQLLLAKSNAKEGELITKAIARRPSFVALRWYSQCIVLSPSSQLPGIQSHQIAKRIVQKRKEKCFCHSKLASEQATQAASGPSHSGSRFIFLDICLWQLRVMFRINTQNSWKRVGIDFTHITIKEVSTRQVDKCHAHANTSNAYYGHVGCLDGWLAILAGRTSQQTVLQAHLFDKK